MDPTKLWEKNTYEETKLEINERLRKVKENNTEVIDVPQMGEKSKCLHLGWKRNL